MTAPEACAPKRKIAILGAGPAGLAAAFALSRTPDLRSRYAVTIYQMGWRAGGKCATGRALDKGWRIEQNGSHYLFGCYGHSFALLREAYDELARHGITGFGTYRDQFVPRSFIAARQRRAPEGDEGDENETRTTAPDVWESWFRHAPESTTWPDRPGKYPPLSHYLLVGAQILLGLVLSLVLDTDRNPSRSDAILMKLFPLSPFHSGRWARVARGGALVLAWVVDVLVAKVLHGLGWIIFTLSRLCPARLRVRAARQGVKSAIAVIQGLRWLARALDPLSGRHPPAAASMRWGPARRFHRGRILVDLVATMTLGLLRDRLWQPGRLEAIDAEDFRDWLARHGASPEVQKSPVVKIWYDAVVAYEDGSEATPRISAAVTVHALFRAIVTYKGALALQMKHEIGDAFIGPIVKALSLRGIDFRFFHRVRDVEATPESTGAVIETLTIERQIPELRRRQHRLFVSMPAATGTSGSAAPSREVWPNRPVFEDEPASQLERPAPLEDPPLDSYFHGTGAAPPAETFVLRRGSDFDDVVFALPIEVARDFTAFRRHPAWINLHARVKSVATQSLRLWFRRSLSDLGWPFPQPILSGYTSPYSTWEDNSQSVDHERFIRLGLGEEPRSVATLFGPLPDLPAFDPTHRPLPLAFAHQQQAAALAAGWRFFQRELSGLWPAIAGPGENKYAALAAPAGLEGPARLHWQYLRANAGPNEAYVLALPGTLKDRLRPDESGFSNLFVAGEWTRNGIEVGCVEGSVRSGLTAAAAIQREPAALAEDALTFGLFRTTPSKRAA